MPDAVDAVQSFAQEALVVGGAGDRHLDEIIVVPRHKVALQHLGYACELTAELLQHMFVMLLERDLDEDDIAEAQRRLIDDRRIAFDRAVCLKAPDARPARRWRKADLLRQLVVGEARIPLQGG